MSRSRFDANASINLACVRGVLGIGLALAAGAIGLAALKIAVPEWFGNALMTITGGLIGYLSRDPKHPSTGAAVTTESVETVNVEGAKGDSAQLAEGEPL